MIETKNKCDSTSGATGARASDSLMNCSNRSPTAHDQAANATEVEVCFYSGRTAVWWKRIVFAIYRFVTGAKYIHVNVRLRDGRWLQCDLPGKCRILESHEWNHRPDKVITTTARNGIGYDPFVLGWKSSLRFWNCGDATLFALRIGRDEFSLLCGNRHWRYAMGFLSPPKVTVAAAPPAEDATKVLKKETKQRDKATQSFAQRQGTMGPVQLMAPNLRTY